MTVENYTLTGIRQSTAVFLVTATAVGLSCATTASPWRTESTHSTDFSRRDKTKHRELQIVSSSHVNWWHISIEQNLAYSRTFTYHLLVTTLAYKAITYSPANMCLLQATNEALYPALREMESRRHGNGLWVVSGGPKKTNIANIHTCSIHVTFDFTAII